MMSKRESRRKPTATVVQKAMLYEIALLTEARMSAGNWGWRKFSAAPGIDDRGVRVRMTRISRLVAFGTPNPVSKIAGVTIWQMRRISNCAQSCASTRCRSCAKTSPQNSVRIDGIDSGAIRGQSSWDVPNNAINARADPFMCRMRADEENTIMPESGEGSRSCCISPVLLRPISGGSETSCCGELPWFCRVDRGIYILSGK
jgi:hypothetical protein